jgi:SAM-dependent methyltransferase
MELRLDEPRRPDEGKVSAHWGATLHEVERTFYGFPPLRPYFYRSIAGRSPAKPLGRDWFERWAVDEVLGERAPVGECLSLCCGFGEIERILAGLGAFRHCRAVDLAGPAIESARAAAVAEGLSQVTYEVADVESLELEPESVDLVWANGALHHLARLEHVVDQVYRALRPGGLVIANEYIGPDHQQLSRREGELVNAVIHLIPPELRYQSEATFVPARFKGPRALELAFRALAGRLPDPSSLTGWQRRVAKLRRLVAPSQLRPARDRVRFGKVWDNNPWYFRAVDPSEGVRASQIVGALRARFGDVEVRAYNGSILAHALDTGFYDAFDPQDDRHRRVLDLLTDLEASLIDAGEIAPHHAALICVKQS